MTPDSSLGGGHLQRVGSPDQPTASRDDQREAERHHQEGVRVAPVKTAQDDELERPADQPDDERGDGQRDPEAARPAHQRVADERAQHVERAMREIDDAHDAEDEGQADAEEEQQRGLRQRIDALVEEEGERAHGPPVREARSA